MVACPPEDGGVRVALARHAERADASWESDWCTGEDARSFPLDPPLTDTGVTQAPCSLA